MAESGGRDDLVKQFREVTGLDEERSRFYLEAADWKLHEATAAFYDGHEHESDPEDIPAVGATVLKGSGGSGGSQPPSRGGLFTFDALRGSDSERSGEDEARRGQAFYAGGSQSSGQQVLGPPREPKSSDDIIADMFKKAREQGAQEAGGGGSMEAAAVTKRGKFGGVGYKLGESESEPSEMVGLPLNQSRGGAAGRGGVRELVLRLWSSGFTVDDGPLRDYRDPGNMAFLDALKRTEIPAELRREFQGEEIALRLEDKREEDYVPPKVKVKPFEGKGQILGSPAPATISTSSVSGGGSTQERKANEERAREELKLREGEPTTSIQLRLHDGSRLVLKLNHSHTLNDLHTFINTARPEYVSVNYVLTMFPNIELLDMDKSLKEMNVLNSALNQKLK